MLKDIKEFAPELGDHRLDFVDIEPKIADSQNTTTTLNKSNANEIRYLDPKEDKLRIKTNLSFKGEDTAARQTRHKEINITEQNNVLYSMLSTEGANIFQGYIKEMTPI